MDSRFQQHQEEKIGYTSTRKPFELVWQGAFETRLGAIEFEQQIKGWSRAKKEALIRGDWEGIKQLARSNNPVRSEPNNFVRTTTNFVRTTTAPVRTTTAPVRTTTTPVRAELVEALQNPSTSSGRTAIKERGNDASQTLRQAQGERGGIQRERILLDGVLGGDSLAQRRAIAKAITLMESTRADHRAQADELLTALLPHTGKSLRLGISGVPGVGKSTLIEALGLYLIELGHRVAVLTIDPSSTVSGGSILGDKTRMEKLSVDERAYIRPSPSSGTLGGVAEKTREAMLVCEAAGYDIVIVETVGVGQSETAVAGMTDMFVLMQLPNAGDDLQAIKKGVMELADLVLINKSDIDPLASERARLQITAAMQLLGMFGGYSELNWHPKALLLSALNGQGVEAFWAAVNEFKTLQNANGKLAERRKSQSLAWMWERIDAGLKLQFKQNPQVQALLPQLLKDVSEGRVAASTAARNLLNIEKSGQIST
jgi:LAO/AO transport system kinase